MNRVFIHNSHATTDTLEISATAGEYGGLFCCEDESGPTGGPVQYAFEVADSDVCDDEMLLDVRFDEALEAMCPEMSQSERDSVISGKCVPDADSDWEMVLLQSMHLQQVRGKLAASFGYKAVSMIDETGTSYLLLEGVGRKL